MLWCIDCYSNNKNKHNDVVRNSYLSMYTLSRDLCIPPLAGIHAMQQLKCFIKWKSSKCIIKDLINFIPPMSSLLLN